MLCLIFLSFVRTIKRVNYGEQESKHKQSAVYNSDTPVTLKQGQGHQASYEVVDPKQGCNDSKFENPCLNGVYEKVNNKVFVKSENT